jgi:hypothetical protein
MDQIVAGLDERVVALTLAIAMLAAWAVGKWMGRRLLSQPNPKPKPSKFNDAGVAIMGLLLAFAFGASISKYDQRRMAVVEDSNAISDFYTCAGLLKEPIRTELQSVIQQYAQLRLDRTRAPMNDAVIESMLIKFDRMHRQMSELLGQALADGTPIAVPLTNALNTVSSNQASGLAAIRDRLPTSILILLFTSAIVTALLIGREQGSTENREVAGVLCFILLVSVAVYVTLDLNLPGRGLIRASQEPIERLVASMRK